MSEIPDTLDPGITEVVAFLRRHGFRTTDSGDGHSKGDTMDCALDVPNVAMVCDPGTLLAEADRLRAALEATGVALAAEDAPSIQASYDPVDGSAVLLLLGLDDNALHAAVAAALAGEP